MDVREKLVELIEKASYECDEGTRDLWDMRQVAEGIADFLIANGVTVQEWISVKDRLSDESGMYIVTANDGHAQRVSFVLWQKKNRMWKLTGARSYWRITHWMPLPEPPKGE